MIRRIVMVYAADGLMAFRRRSAPIPQHRARRRLMDRASVLTETVGGIIEITKGAYGADAFAGFFKVAVAA